jgi:hypothetical protein
MNETNDPKTLEQWQEAMDMAHFLLSLESARRYGLVKGGPEVNVVRCLEIIQLGREKGMEPRPGAVEQILAANIHLLRGEDSTGD